MAAANLRQVLLRIRHVQNQHGFTFVDANFSTVFVQRSSTAAIDLLALLDRLTDAAPAAAVDLCQLATGDLLADLGDSGPEFEEWLASQRSHLRNRCADRLAAALAQSSGLSGAQRVTCAQKLLELDPCDENAYRQLMIEASAHGQGSRVHMLFDACQRQLLRDLGARPSQLTTTLFRQLTKG